MLAGVDFFSVEVLTWRGLVTSFGKIPIHNTTNRSRTLRNRPLWADMDMHWDLQSYRIFNGLG